MVTVGFVILNKERQIFNCFICFILLNHPIFNFLTKFFYNSFKLTGGLKKGAYPLMMAMIVKNMFRITVDTITSVTLPVNINHDWTKKYTNYMELSSVMNLFECSIKKYSVKPQLMFIS
jgi:hypothetical protein